MSYHSPEMPIQVDDETGVWTTDALPMLYVPRHFFVNNHMAIEAELGADKYAQVLYRAGYKSAYYWCEKEAECHGLSGDAVFDHYMKRLSQRGWGLFFTEELDIAAGTCKVRLENSAFVYQYGKVNRMVDYMFTGWFSGAIDQIAKAQGLDVRTLSEQTQCGAQEGFEVGYFETRPVITEDDAALWESLQPGF
ncbi:MAG: hydrocarbon binding protein [Oceanospirillaceae bacterium]|nr:hydrocarbon binding protein [Oceanospirillaceae bacterium]MBT11272.1 hydrocarbon binding protein [Oceanospirillaceae bacterium]|tara:strand:+ start:128693 stop:129271 length:579 start_codon:yes stop_codon:yes gene_type:complete